MNEETPSPKATSSDEVEEVYTSVIYRNDQEIRPAKLLKNFKDNPNRFALENEGKKFRVIAKIQRVPEFTEVLADSSGYYLPLLVRSDLSAASESFEGIASKESNLPRVESISMFVKDFDQRKAAELDRGQEVAAECVGLRVVMDGLVFDDCSLKSVE